MILNTTEINKLVEEQIYRLMEQKRAHINRHTEKAAYCLTLIIWQSGSGKTKDSKRISGFQGVGGGEREG